MTETPPAHLTDWRGQDWTPDSGTTGRSSQRPLHRPGRPGPGDRARVGGSRRRADLGDPLRWSPLVASCRLITEAFDWQHGVFLGSIMASETTAAAAGAVGKLRRDPFAMLPFCGYNMADYIAHWLEIGREADTAKLPRLFYVNWFRKGRGRQVPLARVRREQPGPRVGVRTMRRPWQGGRDADRLPAGPGAIPTDGLDIAARGHDRAAEGGRRPNGARSWSRSPPTSTVSASGSLPSCSMSWPDWRNASAEDSVPTMRR